MQGLGRMNVVRLYAAYWLDSFSSHKIGDIKGRDEVEHTSSLTIRTYSSTTYSTQHI